MHLTMWWAFSIPYLVPLWPARHFMEKKWDSMSVARIGDCLKMWLESVIAWGMWLESVIAWSMWLECVKERGGHELADNKETGSYNTNIICYYCDRLHKDLSDRCLNKTHTWMLQNWCWQVPLLLFFYLKDEWSWGEVTMEVD